MHERHRGGVVLAAVLLSTLVFPLSITGASTALPDLQAQLGGGLTAAQWVVNAYSACFAAFLLVAGSVADAVGRRGVYAAGVGLFLLSGVLVPFVQDVGVLIALRALAGVGAAAAVAGGTSLLAAAFEGPARARAFGLLGTVLGAGTAFGPAVSGLLVQTLGWRSAFVVPALVAGAALLLVPLLPSSRGTGRREPLVDLAPLTDRGFVAYALAAATFMAVLVPLLVYLPSYLITVVGLSAAQAGLWLLMLTVPTLLLPTVGAELAARLPHTAVVVGALVLCGTGALGLLVLGPDVTPVSLVVPFTMIGAGVGLTNGLIDGLAVGRVPAERAGTAAGVFNAVRLTLETIAIAVVGALLAVLTGGRLEGAEFTGAFHTVALSLGGLTAVVVVAVCVLNRRSAPSEGSRVG